MTGKIRLLMMLSMAGMMATSGAQQIPNNHDMEDALYSNETAVIPEPGTGEFGDSGLLLLNLNTATALELESSGAFTTFQAQQLVNYRERFGPLYSIHELAALPGFHPGLLLRIESRVSVSNEPVPPKHSSRHMLLLTLERCFPAAEASEDYAGSLFKSSLRILSRPRKFLRLALSYEKDAGETFAYRNRPQFFSAYLSYEGKGFLKQVVAGNYQLNQGLGLVNGTGFLHRAGKMRISRQSISRIKPYASLAESRYEQGLACRMGTTALQCMLWASFHKFSISPSAITAYPGTDQWLKHQYSTGLFRSPNELENRDMANRIHTGIQVLYLNQGLSLGVLGGGEWVLPGKKTIGILENLPEASFQQHLSLHWNWYRNRIQVFGELAAGNFGSLGFILGARYQFNDYIRGTLLLHHYGKGYRGCQPSSYGSGSQLQNDQGLAFHLHMESGKAMLITLTGELFRYPAPRYLTRVPSEGCRLDLCLQDPGNNTLRWRARLVSKFWETTPQDGNSPVRPLLISRIHRLDGQLIYRLEERFRWMSRLILGFCSHRQNTSTAYAAVQRVSYDPGPVKITLQCVLFHIDDWANRVYLHEPGFYYSFSFPVYYGSGQKSSLLLTYKPLKKLWFSLRISSTNKKGIHQFDSGIQIRLRL